jgi:hypothetical protein
MISFMISVVPPNIDRHGWTACSNRQPRSIPVLRAAVAG